MKKYGILLVLYLLTAPQLMPQRNSIDSLKRELNKAASDQARFGICNDIGDFIFSRLLLYDSAMYFYKQADEIAKRNNQRLLDAFCMTKIGFCTMLSQNGINTYDSIQKGFELAQHPGILNGKSWGFDNIPPETLQLIELGWLNLLMGHLQKDQLGNIRESIKYFHECRKLALAAKDSALLGFGNGSIIHSFLKGNMPDSALIYGRALEQNITYSIDKDIFHFMTMPHKNPYYLKDIGVAYLKLNNKPLFLKYLWTSINLANEENFIPAMIEAYKTITQFYLSERNKDSSFYYTKKILQYVSTVGYEVYENLYKCYELINKPDSVAKYMKLTLSGLNEYDQYQLETTKEIQRMTFQKQVQLQALEKEKIENEGKLKTFSIIGLILVFGTIGFLLYRNSQRQQKARAIIEKSYSQLKATQSQLIQSEKMASLGELTAGIAHEIQNPLNFVNNFSEVNTELLQEMKQEIGKGNLNEVESIANAVIDNEQKINHHGKRADSIVKGMLQHSRNSTGKKEPADINALADEYLRLAYHGLRAKDHSFNAALQTDFDKTIEKINIIPQDIGRVLLNLYNNAFYAVIEKKKQVGDNYEPTLSVSTKKTNGKVEIRVADNGNGIPQKVLDKIFQPFFTTKPTGQGTGLGLSLSYDIIKAHGGQIKVNTTEGKFAEFVVQLPIRV